MEAFRVFNNKTAVCLADFIFNVNDWTVLGQGTAT